MLICLALNLPCVANLRCDFALHCEPALPCKVNLRCEPCMGEPALHSAVLHRTVPCIKPCLALNLLPR